MKMRNKGKVHPFISSSNKEDFSVLNLLPAAIFTLLSVLSLQDREVLAYMITRSLKSTQENNNKKSSKKTTQLCCDGHVKSPALFDCDCFHCYTAFWFRWDSSPNRELIHHAIEAFEEHLNNGELFKNGSSSGKSKRKDRLGRRKIEKLTDDGGGGGVDVVFVESSPENVEKQLVGLPDGAAAGTEVDDVASESEVVVVENGAAAGAVRGHRGLARKVLPDVIGILNSRLWSLWSPNV